jgi:WhiB family transcriptional regulator, redox-sensing transcriptional regulator
VVVEWAFLGACGDDPERFFVPGAEQHDAKRVCAGCPVRLRCLAEALDNGWDDGVWGGMTERERRTLLRRYPHVDSWRRLLDDTVAAAGAVR